jgi:hypothetical protein
MRCLLNNGKKTTDKENIMAAKPTKQQVAQGKARAGGNNPIKVTNAGLKKLGSAVAIAASLTPTGRVVRGAATAAKAVKAETIMAKAGWNAAAKKGYRADVKRGTYATPKSNVTVKPAAKQIAGKKDIQTFINKRAVRNAQINEAQKGDDFVNSGIRQPGPFSDGKTKLLRQVKASNKKK